MPAMKALSTSSGVATPSSTSRTASFISSTWRRGPMKPGESPQRTGVLPSVCDHGDPLLRRARLEIDEVHAAAAESKRDRDLPPDPPWPENGNLHHRVLGCLRTTMKPARGAAKPGRRAVKPAH